MKKMDALALSGMKEMQGFALYSVGLTVDFGNYRGHECEVIGNIFDNPDLLPEEDT